LKSILSNDQLDERILSTHRFGLADLFSKLYSTGTFLDNEYIYNYLKCLSTNGFDISMKFKEDYSEVKLTFLGTISSDLTFEDFFAYQWVPEISICSVQ